MFHMLISRGNCGWGWSLEDYLHEPTSRPKKIQGFPVAKKKDGRRSVFSHLGKGNW
eukprot:UN22805